MYAPLSSVFCVIVIKAQIILPNDAESNYTACGF